MAHSGKLVILAIFALGLALTGVALRYHYAKSRRTIEFWGSENAALITRAPKVEVWRLVFDGPADDEERVIDFAGERWAVSERKDITGAKGLIHLRAALVEDDNFDWDLPQNPNEPVWDRALRFSDGPQEAVLVYATNCHCVGLLGSGTMASVRPIGKGLNTFLAEQFPIEKGMPGTTD